MKLVLTCTALLMLAAAVELASPRWRKRSSIARIFQAANITPIPEQTLELQNDDGEPISPGENVSADLFLNVPVISFDFTPGSYYTFIALNLDLPCPADPYLSPFIIGLYTNILADEEQGVILDESCEVATWIPPFSIPGAGPQRIVLYVFLQLEILNVEELKCFQTQRAVFPTEDFIRDFNLTLIAGTLIFTEYPNC